MIDNKAVMQQALESLIESARLLGATQEKRSWTGYTKTDSMFESACYEIIEAKKQTILDGIEQPARVPETDCGNIAQPEQNAAASKALITLISRIKNLNDNWLLQWELEDTFTEYQAAVAHTKDKP